LSDSKTVPRFKANNIIGQSVNDINNLLNYESNVDDILNMNALSDIVVDHTVNKSVPSKKTNGVNFEELIESLDDSTDVDINDIIENSINKKSKNDANKQMTSITKKPKNNSVTRSIKKNKSESLTDYSVSRGNRIYKI